VKIDSECKKQDKSIKILLQVNIAEEPQKHGVKENEIENAVEEISRLRNIKLDGFMMIAPNIEPEKTRIFFKEMKNIYDKYKEKYSLKLLSMGMSSDYKIAVEEGSNMVRIGTKLFK
jgi:hypothetical protein